MAKSKKKCECCAAFEKRIKGKVRSHYVRKGAFKKLKKKVAALEALLEEKKGKDSSKKKVSQKKVAAESSVKPPAKKKAPAPVKKKSPAKKRATASFETGAKEDAELGVVYTKKPTQIDDLKLISGVGPSIEKKLHEFGVYQFRQIGTWKKITVDAFDERLSFRGRIGRDQWIMQAKQLAK